VIAHTQSPPHLRLADLCSKVFHGISASRQVAGGVERPVIQIRDLYNGRVNAAGLKTVPTEQSAVSDYGVQGGDIVVSAKGTIGKVALIDDGEHGWVISSNVIALRPRKDLINPAYLYAYFRSEHAPRQLDSIVVASATVKALRASDLAELVIPVPDRATQDLLGRLALACDEYVALADQCTIAAKQVLNEVLTSRISGKGGRLLNQN